MLILIGNKDLKHQIGLLPASSHCVLIELDGAGEAGGMQCGVGFVVVVPDPLR